MAKKLEGGCGTFIISLGITLALFLGLVCATWVIAPVSFRPCTWVIMFGDVSPEEAGYPEDWVLTCIPDIVCVLLFCIALRGIYRVVDRIGDKSIAE